tara:strand:+ start:58 stop:672 length:615 start_codon:yes stop_codon:yes gene_type:complete
MIELNLEEENRYFVNYNEYDGIRNLSKEDVMRVKSVSDFQAQFSDTLATVYAKGANDQHFNAPIYPDVLQDPKSEIASHEIKSLVLYAVFYMISAHLEEAPAKQSFWRKLLGLEPDDAILWEIDMAVTNGIYNRLSNDNDPIDVCVRNVIRMIEGHTRKALKRPNDPRNEVYLNLVRAIYKQTHHLQWEFSEDLMALLFKGLSE